MDVYRRRPGRVGRSEPRRPGGRQRVLRRVVDLHTQGWLPYTLRWQFPRDRKQPPRGVTIVATPTRAGHARRLGRACPNWRPASTRSARGACGRRESIRQGGAGDRIARQGPETRFRELIHLAPISAAVFGQVQDRVGPSDPGFIVVREIVRSDGCHAYRDGYAAVGRISGMLQPQIRHAASDPFRGDCRVI